MLEQTEVPFFSKFITLSFLAAGSDSGARAPGCPHPIRLLSAFVDVWAEHKQGLVALA